MNRKALVASAMSLFLGSASLHAADGDLDTTYDTDGINFTSFGASDNVYGGWLQTDGKMLVIGGGRPATNQEMSVARFNTNGSLDTTFATAGKFSLDINPATTTDRGTCGGQQSDGKIIIGGYSRTGSGNDDFAVIRLTTAGVLDTTFGTAGIAKVDFNGGSDRISACIVLADNRIAMAGFAGEFNLSPDINIGVAMLTANGALDTTFDTDGRQTIDVGDQQDDAHSIAVQADGKILVGGAAIGSGVPQTVVIARLTTTGAFDSTFGGGDGIFSQSLGASIGDFAEAIAVQADGKILASGRSAPSGSFDAMVMRLNANGTLDTTFNGTGFLTFDLGSGSDSMDALIVQPDGRYMLGGYFVNPGSGSVDSALARISSGGTLDATFGTGGVRKHSLVAGNDQLLALYLDSSNRLVAALEGGPASGQEDFYTARFQNTVNVVLPTLSINDVSVTEGNAGTTNANFTVSLSAPAGAGGVTFDIATANNTAVGGADYVTRSLTGQSIPAGSSTFSFTVQVNGDLLDEPNETYFVNVTNVVGATVGDSQGLGTINDDDAAPSLSINDVSLAEGNSGTSNANFTVSLSAASGQTVTVNYATSDGSATAGSDYTATSGTLTFTPGQTTRPVAVTVQGDTTLEPNETFNVALSSPTNATIGDGAGIGSILNDDAQADLSINKTNGTSTTTAGGSTTYTITASNAGPDPVTGATVADTFPAILTCNWTCVGAGGGTCTASGAGNISQSVNLPVGAAVTFTASCAVSPAATGTLSNTATVSSGATDPTPANNSATDTDTLVQSADLAITKTNGAASTVPGASTTYTIAASNAGPSNASATVADTFPASLTCNWTCVGAGGGTCAANGSGNINQSVVLPVGGAVTYTASCTISAAATGTLSNTATVASAINDPVPGNNSATDSDTLTRSGDLSITKTNGASTSTPGGSTTYTIVASNAGPSNMTGTVADTFPASLTCTWTCVGAGGGTCTAAGSGNINDPVNLPSGGSATYTASCSISAAATGTLSNTATVSSADTDPNPANNAATDSDTLSPQADVAITKTDGQTNVNAGSNTVYTIHVSNAGPSNAPAATVADTFPAACVSPTWLCGGSSGGTCLPGGGGNINQVVNLPAGGSVTFTATCPINSAATGTLSNTATATAGVTDPNAGNNSATDTSTVVAVPVVSIDSVGLTEGDSGSSNLVFTVTRTTTSTAFDVNYATADGTAAAGSDYTNTSGTLSFTAGGAATQTISVPVTGDLRVEGSESFTLTLSGATGTAQIGTGTGTGTITDNDSAVVSFAAAGFSQSEGSSPMAFTVTLSNPVQSGVTLTVNSTNGSAGGSDFTSITGGTVSFPANSSAAQTINVTLNNDALDEDDETFTLTLSGLSATGNVTLGTATATGTILDNDATPTLSITSPSQNEGNSGTSTMTFTVSLSAVSGRTVSFNAATANGTATAPSDYLALASTPFTIAAGQTSVAIPVTINGDTTFEGNETFSVNLTGITNATPGTLSGTGTLVEDDQQPTTTTITSDLPDPSVVGQPYTVSVNVAAVSSSPTGTVNVSDGSASCTLTLAPATSPNSTGSCALTSTTAGAKTLTASYTAATTAFGNSSGTTTHQVNPASTAISVTGPTRSRINQPTSFSFALSVNAPGAGTPTGTVTLSSGASSCTATLPATSCNLSFSTLGNRTVSASYAGDANFSGSTSSGAGNALTLVYAQSDLSISKSDGIGFYEDGDLLVYTVVVRNLGPDAAANIRVIDIIPPGLANTVWTCDASGGGVCPVSGGAGNLDTVLPTVSVGALLNFTFYGNVDGSPETIANTASIELPADTTVEDPVTGNNSATDTNRIEFVFQDGFEDAAVSRAAGDLRLPGIVLAQSLGEVAQVVQRLNDADGDALRVYARLHGDALQYALAMRGADGRLRLGAWTTLPGEPQLRWTARQSAKGWILQSAELR